MAGGPVKQSAGNAKRKPGPGRPKGVPNKITMDMREAMVQAFEKKGGVKYLEMLATKHPALFVTMLTKMIPAAVEAKVQGNIVYRLIDGVPDADLGD